jgi:hypothetical protein
MADLTSANYVFLPWVRQGAASGIQTTDLSANQAGVVSVTVKLRVNNTDDVERQVRLYGPGDVTGIDPQQVIRTEPRHLATDFEPNYFPAIDFDRPDFPWLFTPAKADATGKLRPWLCLVVARKQEGVTLRIDRNLPLPVLEIKAPAQPELELPDLSESWAWAHVQVAGTRPDAASLKTALAGDPALTVSRLLCPRRLDPLTEYFACVVPAFDLGRRAGLGDPIRPDDEKELKPAWVSGAQPSLKVTLPVYFFWEFRTGTGGDFESLVGLLKAREIPAEVGKRLMDISHPGFAVRPEAEPNAEGTTLGLEGALRVVDSQPDEWPAEVRLPFQTALQEILNTPWEVATKERADNEINDPIVGPPIYGCWQAARHMVDITPAPSASLNWLDELNLDPRHRAVASLGTQVVQTQQEQLMASAWEQLGEIERINQMRRQAQLGRAVNAVYHVRHFTQFSDEMLLKVLAPAQSRVVIDARDNNNVMTRVLLSQRISQSTLPARAISAPLRRLTSPRGVISTRFLSVGAPPIAIVAKLNTATPIVLFQKKQAGLVTINQVSDNQSGAFAGPLKQTVLFERISKAIETTPPLGDFNIVPEGFVPKRSLLSFKPRLPDSPDAAMFRKVVKAHQDYMEQVFMPSKTIQGPTKNLFESDIKDKLLQSVNPEKTINARVQASLIIAGGAETSGDPLEPILDAPKFPQPMYEALRDLSQDFLLPGLEHVLPNTVALLETNPTFVESFLVGLNTEMSSELLWRNYPTDQRGTYFRQFWDTSAGNGELDVEPITKWGNQQLGQNTPRTSGKLVLLIRGELLRRYPNSVIYAVRAVKTNSRLDLSRKPEDERHPLFRGTLKPDVTFVGFNLTDAEALGKPPHDTNGWFFVIQQQPTEPRFGMDVADFEGTPQPQPLTTWNDLSWRHLVNTEEELKALSHASINTVLPDIDEVKWGKNSAHQAFITLQRPVRIAIHATQMIKDD